MKNTRTANSAHTFIWMLAFVVMTTLVPFAIRTLMIRLWGMDYAGLSSLFSAVFNVLNVSELGIGEALVYSMYKPAAENDVDRVNALLRLYQKIYRGLGVIIGVIGVCLIPFLPHLINGSYPADINLLILYLIYFVNITGSYFVCAYCISVFKTHQSLYIDYKWRTIITLIMYTLQIIVIIFTHNYYLYIIWLPVSTICINIADYVLMKRFYPMYHPEGTLEKGFIGNLKKQVIGMGVRKLRDAIRNSIDYIVISSELGLIILAKYQNYNLIMAIPVFIIFAIKSSVLQGFGNSVAMEKTEKTYHIFKQYIFLNQWITVWMAAVLLCLYRPFIILWIGEQSTFSFGIEVLFAVYLYVVSITYLADMVRSSTGVWWEGKWIPIVESIANLLLDIVMIKFWGICGVLVATILTMVLINIPFETIYIYKYYFHKNPCKDMLEYVWNAIIAIIVVMVTYLVCSMFEGSVIKVFIFRLLISITLPNIMMVIINLRNNLFTEIISRIKNIFF